jgi:serine/threonine protein kinase
MSPPAKFDEDQGEDPAAGDLAAEEPSVDAPPPEETKLRVGAPFHLFHVVRMIGRGGTSEVYEILFKGARWALKVPRRGFELTEVQRKRFEREASLLLQIQHPNVIDVQDYGYHEGVFWIRMELLDGLDLREAISRLGAMSVGLVGAWLVQAAHGVHQCHMFGIVHRDLKPENVFITRDNVVKILDFGIVKHEHTQPTQQTGQGTAAPIGTAPYMSPEQARGGVVAAVSDVYALGMMMVEMLLGEHPFLLDGAEYEFWSMLQKQVLEPVPPLTTWNFPPELSRVAERALSKRPQDRQPNGLRFAEELFDECIAYLRAHPDEEPNPGEPTIAWLLEANIEVPSFGTGPQAGRPSVPPPRGSKPPEGRSPVRLSAELRPVIRFGTLPMGTSELGERDTEPTPPPVDAHDAQPKALERDTDPSGIPLALRRFDTISLPPQLRDPTAIRALAGYRTTRPRPPGSAHAAAQPAAGHPASPPEAAPPAADRFALLPGTAPAAADRRAPEQRPPAATDAAGEAGQAREGTPTAAVVPVPPPPAPGTPAPSPPQAAASEVPTWERGGLPRLSRRLLRPALLVLGGLVVSLALTLEVRVRRPALEAGPSLVPSVPAPSASATASATAAVASSPDPSAATAASPALTDSPVATATSKPASVPAPPVSTGARARVPTPRAEGTPARKPKPRLGAPAASSSAPPAPTPTSNRLFGAEN